jgi:NAD(P)-dependent dehydrogenase (short-subunit alcohol dehydrogenase family)
MVSAVSAYSDVATLADTCPTLLVATAYNASKAAANHLTETIAFEFTSTVEAKIRVNAVAPGVFPSEMTAGGSDDKNQSDLSEKLPTMSVPAGRPGQTEDMVRILFLASMSTIHHADHLPLSQSLQAQTIQFLAACEFLHGQIVVCDGGFTLTEP